MTDWQQNDINIKSDGDELTLHCYRTGGEQLPVLIMAHGFSDNGLCWQRTAEMLETHFDVIMFDARNHGLSSRATASADAMVEDLRGLVASVLEEKGETPYLLGHSMGASTVAGMVAKYPDLVTKAVLEDPPWIAAGKSEKSEAEREAESQKRAKGFEKYIKDLWAKSDEELLAFARGFYPDWHDDDLPAWADSKRQIDLGAMGGLSLGGWRETAAQISVPTLLVYSDGQRDGLLKQLVVDDLKSNPCFSTAEIKDAGHNIRRENFADYISAVRDYLLA